MHGMSGCHSDVIDLHSSLTWCRTADQGSRNFSVQPLKKVLAAVPEVQGIRAPGRTTHWHLFFSHVLVLHLVSGQIIPGGVGLEDLGRSSIHVCVGRWQAHWRRRDCLSPMCRKFNV